jgi:hypothetical protein
MVHTTRVGVADEKMVAPSPEGRRGTTGGEDLRHDVGINGGITNQEAKIGERRCRGYVSSPGTRWRARFGRRRKGVTGIRRFLRRC